MSIWQGWEQELLAAIGAPSTPQNISFLDAWANAEGGSASYNPMNTTQPASGAMDYNSAGVKEYTSAQQGIVATAQTLENGYYPTILSGLKSGNPLTNAGSELNAELNKWGTGSGFLSSLGGSMSNGPFQSLGNLAQNPINGIISNLTGFDPAKAIANAFDPKKLAPLFIGIIVVFIGLAVVLSDHPEIIQTAAKAAV